MVAKLTFHYDAGADILHIDKRAPYPEQLSEELGDEVIARLHPETGDIENLEVLFFTSRSRSEEGLELPVTMDLPRNE